MYREIIKEICTELDIKYTLLSKDWIIKLEKDGITKYLTGNKFDLNGHAVGNILDDKYAFYDCLKNLNIPVCEHTIFYRSNNKNSFAIGCHTKEELIALFNKYNQNVVVKPNHGSMGIGVSHVTNETDLFKATNRLFKENYSISICPFYQIKNEYRVIVLNNELKLMFKKEKPTVIGNGTSSVKELLLKFNPYYFSKISLPDTILKKGEVYDYDFKFNLSRGSIATIDIDSTLKEQIATLALNVTKKLGITFASIDIIETEGNELLVMEGNSGVTINKVIDFIPNGYEIAKNIYKEAILKMFTK